MNFVCDHYFYIWPPTELKPTIETMRGGHGATFKH